MRMDRSAVSAVPRSPLAPHDPNAILVAQRPAAAKPQTLRFHELIAGASHDPARAPPHLPDTERSPRHASPSLSYAGLGAARPLRAQRRREVAPPRHPARPHRRHRHAPLLLGACRPGPLPADDTPARGEMHMIALRSSQSGSRWRASRRSRHAHHLSPRRPRSTSPTPPG